MTSPVDSSGASLTDRTIAALRSAHGELSALVPSLSDEQLSGTSGASEWTVAQVLSHLGSGAEITLAGYRAALVGDAAPGQDFNQSVWDRWDDRSPQEQATGFVQHDAGLVDMLESLTPEERQSLQVKLGFLPAPLPLASAAGMRLHEVAQHAWDVRVALDPAALLDAASAGVLVEHFTGELGFLVGFFGKADRLSEPALVRIGRSDVAIAVDDQVSLTTTTDEVTATFTGEVEAAIRLIGGRLTPPYTPAGVEVTGNVTLDDLRSVFPGF
jgi:uncharacterized protein (TIGR03083 family)